MDFRICVVSLTLLWEFAFFASALPLKVASREKKLHNPQNCLKILPQKGCLCFLVQILDFALSF